MIEADDRTGQGPDFVVDGHDRQSVEQLQSFRRRHGIASGRLEGPLTIALTAVVVALFGATLWLGYRLYKLPR